MSEPKHTPGERKMNNFIWEPSSDGSYTFFREDGPQLSCVSVRKSFREEGKWVVHDDRDGHSEKYFDTRAAAMAWAERREVRLNN